MKITYKSRKIAVILSAMLGLSTLSFNCAPGLFQSMNYSYLDGKGQLDQVDTKLSPWALLNTGQVLESFASLTGFSGNITASQRSEYTVRSGALSQTDKISDINAPLQLGATSLAGEFCNGVITRESAAGATRQFFPGVNFNAALSANSAASYSSSVEAMANGFWGRAPSAEEQQILTAYYTDFVASAGTATAQTKNLYLSTCAAMLASFDAMTF